MAWTELPTRRNQRNRTYQHSDDPRRKICSAALTALHYESTPDSGVFDTQVDCTPQRIDTPALDGWRITASGWHYALGQPSDKSTDGWVGFGGRQGAHWFKFRLTQVGYLHWPTRTWQDIDGPPTYDRANLSSQTNILTIGPNADAINVESIAVWSNIWTTPDDGHLSISWRTTGDHLKEEITVNQAARDWIQNNRPPTTPTAETWFGFVFQVDWSDIPQIIRDGLAQSPDDDFADNDQGIELRDALDRLLAFMPLSYAYVGTNENPQYLPLRKRFWFDGEHHYLLVGIRVDQLLTLPDGDLVFDPTVNPQITTSANDALRYDASSFNIAHASNIFGDYGGSLRSSGLRFTLSVPAAATISSATITFTASLTLSDDTVRTKITYQDANDPADFSGDDAASFDARVRSTTEVHWDFTADWTLNSTYDTNDISTVIQALVDEAYWASGEHCVIFVENDSSDTSAHRAAHSYDGSAGDAPILNVTYTTTEGGFFGLAGVIHACLSAIAISGIQIFRRRREGY